MAKKKCEIFFALIDKQYRRFTMPLWQRTCVVRPIDCLTVTGNYHSKVCRRGMNVFRVLQYLHIVVINDIHRSNPSCCRVVLMLPRPIVSTRQNSNGVIRYIQKSISAQRKIALKSTCGVVIRSNVSNHYACVKTDFAAKTERPNPRT